MLSLADFDLATLRHPPMPVGLITAPVDRWLAPRFHSDPLRAACGTCELLADLPGAGHGALLASAPPAGQLGAPECDLLCDPPGYDRPAMTALWIGRTVALFGRHLLDER